MPDNDKPDIIGQVAEHSLFKLLVPVLLTISGTLLVMQLSSVTASIDKLAAQTTASEDALSKRLADVKTSVTDVRISDSAKQAAYEEKLVELDARTHRLEDRLDERAMPRQHLNATPDELRSLPINLRR